MTRVVFMGSPEFAVPSLRALIGEFDVAGVVTQPDRRAGRGKQMKSPPIRLEARKLGLPVMQPERLNDPLALDQLQAWAPELIVVVAFGQILRANVLDLPTHGCINVHASLLPRWRGAAPIQAAIAAGDRESGVTIMKMDAGVDTGPIIMQQSLPLLPGETGGSLSAKLAQLGGRILPPALRGFLVGEHQPRPQDGTRATKAPLLRKEDGRLDATMPAVALERNIRAFNPWPGSFLEWDQGVLGIHAAHVLEKSFQVGARTVVDGQPGLSTAQGILVFDEVQPSGKKRMSGAAFLLGARGWRQDTV